MYVNDRLKHLILYFGTEGVHKYRIVSFWHFLREDNGRSTFIILNVSTTVIGVPIYHELVYTLTATNEQVSLLALTPQRE
jgi:hypothetical protein